MATVWGTLVAPVVRILMYVFRESDRLKYKKREYVSRQAAESNLSSFSHRIVVASDLQRDNRGSYWPTEAYRKRMHSGLSRCITLTKTRLQPQGDAYDGAWLAAEERHLEVPPIFSERYMPLPRRIPGFSPITAIHQRHCHTPYHIHNATDPVLTLGWTRFVPAVVGLSAYALHLHRSFRRETVVLMISNLAPRQQ